MTDAEGGTARRVRTDADFEAMADRLGIPLVTWDERRTLAAGRIKVTTP